MQILRILQFYYLAVPEMRDYIFFPLTFAKISTAIFKP